MDLTRDEIEYMLRQIESDMHRWDHDLELHEAYESIGLQLLSDKGVVYSKNAKESLLRLQRKLEAKLSSMEVN